MLVYQRVPPKPWFSILKRSKWCPNGVQMVSKWSDLDDLGCQFEETRWVSESGFCLLIQLPFEEGQFKGIYIISEIEHDDFQCTLWIIREYVGRLRVK